MLGYLRSWDDGDTGSISCSLQLIENDAAEAVAFVELVAGPAGEVAGISVEDPVGVGGAGGAVQVVALDASGAGACRGEGGACCWDVDADSFKEKLAAVAVDALDAGLVDPDVPSWTVEAGSVGGVVPIAGGAHLHANVLFPVEPETSLAGQYSVIDCAIAKDGDEVSRCAKLTETVRLVADAEVDCLEASSLCENLDLIAAISVQNGGNSGAIGKGNEIACTSGIVGRVGTATICGRGTQRPNWSSGDAADGAANAEAVDEYEGKGAEGAIVSIWAALHAEQVFGGAGAAGSIADEEAIIASGACHIGEAGLASDVDLGAGLAGDVEGVADEVEVGLAWGAELAVRACGAVLGAVDAADIVVVVLVGGAGERASEHQYSEDDSDPT